LLVSPGEHLGWSYFHTLPACAERVRYGLDLGVDLMTAVLSRSSSTLAKASMSLEERDAGVTRGLLSRIFRNLVQLVLDGYLLLCDSALHDSRKGLDMDADSA
ncbi:hypothetical protein FOL47_004497, partial [Perkinsus chesapeaki]